MLVLDSNVWVIAIVEESEEHVDVRNRITRGEEQATVSAYIYEEVIAAFDRSEHVSGDQTQAAIEDFVNLMQTSEYIKGPSYEETKSLELPEVRSQRENVTLGRVLGTKRKTPRSSHLPTTVQSEKHAEERVSP